MKRFFFFNFGGCKRFSWISKWNGLVWSIIWQNNATKRKAHWVDFFFFQTGIFLWMNSHSSHCVLFCCYSFCFVLSFPLFPSRGHLSLRMCSDTLCTVCSHLSPFPLTLIELEYWLSPSGLAEGCSDHFQLEKSILEALFIVSSVFWGWKNTLYPAHAFGKKKITCKGSPVLYFLIDRKWTHQVTWLLMLYPKEDIFLNVGVCVRYFLEEFALGCVSRLKLVFSLFQNLDKFFLFYFLPVLGSSSES